MEIIFSAVVHYKHEEKAASNKDNIIHAQLSYFRMVSFYFHIDIIFLGMLETFSCLSPMMRIYRVAYRLE